MPIFAELDSDEIRDFVDKVVENEPARRIARGLGGTVVPASLREVEEISADPSIPNLLFQRISFNPSKVLRGPVAVYWDNKGRLRNEHWIRMRKPEFPDGEVSLVVTRDNHVSLIEGTPQSGMKHVREPFAGDFELLESALIMPTDPRVYAAVHLMLPGAVAVAA